MRAMIALGHEVAVFEPELDWSLENLLQEGSGARSLAEFGKSYPELVISTYPSNAEDEYWRDALRSVDFVIVHEWNRPELARLFLDLREDLNFRILFHDTHHRASSSPQQIDAFGLARFDGVLAFGEALRTIYKDRFGIERVWALHEAADTTIFHPTQQVAKELDLVWIGNWGDGERSAEIREFLLEPAAQLHAAKATIFGVRYPQDGLFALERAGVAYGGYLPNLDAPAVYAKSRMTIHIPRRQYAEEMVGIPTIRVFEALACGIPLLSAPWQDVEGLFRPGDLHFAANGAQMHQAMTDLLADPAAAAEQARRGFETVQARHTCAHRARELTQICEELLR